MLVPAEMWTLWKYQDHFNATSYLSAFTWWCGFIEVSCRFQGRQCWSDSFWCCWCLCLLSAGSFLSAKCFVRMPLLHVWILHFPSMADTQHVAASLQASWHVPPRSRFLWHLQKDKGIYCLHCNNPKLLFPTLGSWLHMGISCWEFLPVLLQRDVGMLQVLVKHVKHAW